MYPAVVFGSVALILWFYLLQLVVNARAARRSSAPDERFLYAVRHRRFARILLAISITLVPVLKYAVVPAFKAAELHPAPHAVIIVNRVLTLILLVDLGLIFLGRLNGLRKGREAAHRVLGWIAVCIFLLLSFYGTALYFIIYR